MARQLLAPDVVFSVRESDLDLDITPDPEAVYYLRPITTEKAREIGAKNTRMVFNKRTHRQEPADDQQTRIALNNDYLDYAIARWEGVTDHGMPAPCDLEHKLLLPLEVQRALIERAHVGEDQKAATFRQSAGVL